MTGAACAPENRPVVDLTSIITEPEDDEIASTPEEIAAARAICAACPVIAKCRDRAQRVTDVAGMAGGMTDVERTAWRVKHRVMVNVPDIVDVTPASDLTADVLDDLPVMGNGQIHSDVRDVVVRMTLDGMAAAEIVVTLAHPDVTHRTVNYLRRNYMKGYARVDA